MADILWSNDDVIFKDWDVVWKSHESDLQATFSSSSTTLGALNSRPGCVGYIIEGSGVVGFLNIATQIAGSVIGVAYAVGRGRFVFIPIDFYEGLVNQITSYFQDIANANNLIVRYDNDLRGAPTEDLWCEFNIDFGEARQCEMGTGSFRNIGNFNIRIKNSIGLGTRELLEKADLIANSFRSIDINRIIFRVPRIRNVGRIEDDYQINVLCPFFIDN